VEDLDSFFRRVYWYHQKHGFWCMVLQEFLELVQFVFVIVFTVFLRQCVDYKILFRLAFVHVARLVRIFKCLFIRIYEICH
jgi:autophagy-related protein 9